MQSKYQVQFRVIGKLADGREAFALLNQVAGGLSHNCWLASLWVKNPSRWYGIEEGDSSNYNQTMDTPGINRVLSQVNGEGAYYKDYLFPAAMAAELGWIPNA